jgi:ppGpp synthetase/RelA/SpoT-type nucleotidyltranferase
MAVPSSVEEAYRRIEPALTALARYVRSTLRPWCDERDYLYQDRVKRLDSLAEKLETGRYERWSELDDLFACTIVIPTPTHEAAVIAFLEKAFQATELRRRNSTMKAPEVFRFDSTRFIGRVNIMGLSELPPGAEEIRFEIQIPTVFEHAWSVVTHDLAYKADDADWRRARLAAQLKAAVEQIELVIAGFEGNIDFVAQSAYPEVDARQRVVETFKTLRSDGFVSGELEPSSWSRFADNVYALVGSYSSRYQTPTRVVDLCDAVDRHLRKHDPLGDLHSGSLFQAVVGLIYSDVVLNANFDAYVIVDSSELHDIHSVATVPRPFVFD